MNTKPRAKGDWLRYRKTWQSKTPLNNPNRPTNKGIKTNHLGGGAHPIEFPPEERGNMEHRMIQKLADQLLESPE